MATKTQKAAKRRAAQRKRFNNLKHMHLNDNIQRIKLRVKGDPILKQRCRPVDVRAITDLNSGVSNTLKAMMSILVNSKNGAGLSANQAGYDDRIIIVKAYGEYIKMVNPEVSDASDEKVIALEGCLSYPGEFREVSRHKWVEITWHDEKGRRCVEVFSSMEARIAQHELDHLIGICQVHKFELSEIGVLKCLA